jgi:Spondin_N
MRLLVASPFLVVAALLSLEGVHAAGNEEIVLIENKGVTSQGVTDQIRYQCTFRGLWTKERQPKNYPENQARWNGPIIWTHTLQFKPWSNGFAITRGAEKMAEVSSIDLLVSYSQSNIFILNPSCPLIIYIC